MHDLCKALYEYAEYSEDDIVGYVAPGTHLTWVTSRLDTGYRDSA